MENVSHNKLQEKRKEEIPLIIEKYQKLIDNLLDTVSQPMPIFLDLKDEDTGEVTKTGEQQYYDFISVRERAIDNADRMLNKINDLQRELYDPTFFDNVESLEEPAPAKSTFKRYTKK